MNKMSTFWGLSEILAVVESNSNFEQRVKKLQDYNTNAEGRLERFFTLMYHPEKSYSTLVEAVNGLMADAGGFNYNECEEHGVLDATWENSLDVLTNVESDNITNIRVGAENFMFLMEDLHKEDAKIIWKLVQGQPISQFLNYHVVRSAFPDSLPEQKMGKSD